MNSAYQKLFLKLAFLVITNSCYSMTNNKEVDLCGPLSRETKLRIFADITMAGIGVGISSALFMKTPGLGGSFLIAMAGLYSWYISPEAKACRAQNIAKTFFNDSIADLATFDAGTVLENLKKFHDLEKAKKLLKQARAAPYMSDQFRNICDERRKELETLPQQLNNTMISNYYLAKMNSSKKEQKK